MRDRENIARVSNRYRLLLMALFCLVPVVNGLGWFVVAHPEELMEPQAYAILGGVTLTMRILAFLVSMLKGAVVMYGLWILIRLFQLYQQGVFFELANVACFRNMSRALICWVAAGIVSEPLLSLILTMNNPPGEHVVQVSLQSADLTALIVGGILSVISRVMEDGRRLQEELELTV
ncbi:DUF2975 domain-containing protein [Desulfogranum mediterraneum]|uniref:DUF2975 domain-containing protein n=1 Tax=Desulfogranum mediterraneum TaxID=160661 RepID=UPI0003F7044B|nr:DUF2975 domain-containing protein [Desulfogranum mediterraneum]